MTPAGRYQLSLALRSLPWYLVGSYLIVPAFFALFTAGESLFLYIAPFMMFLPTYAKDGGWGVGLIPFAPGFIIWTIRQFFRAALYTRRTTAY